MIPFLLFISFSYKFKFYFLDIHRNMYKYEKKKRFVSVEILITSEKIAPLNKFSR